MTTGELRSRVDRIWDTMWSGGILNPPSVIEEPAFSPDQDSLRLSRFKETEPEKMFATVRAYGSYRSQDFCLVWIDALAAGNPDASLYI